MSKTLYVNGISGKSYIYEGSVDPSTFENPSAGQIGSLYFHSDLSYLGTTTVLTGTITFPERIPNTTYTSGSKGGTGWYTYNTTYGEASYAFGSNPFGAIKPFIGIIDNVQIAGGRIIQSANYSNRGCSIYLTNSEVRIFENFSTYVYTLPSISVSFTVYIFDTFFSGLGSTAISIQPTSFKAGFGKLDSNYRYIKKNTTSPNIYLTSYRTGDVAGGGIKITSPNGTVAFTDASYTGSFQPSIGTGVQI